MLVRCSFISHVNPAELLRWDLYAPAYKNKNNNNISFILIPPAQVRCKNVQVLFLSLFFATSIPRGSINRCILLYYILIYRYTHSHSEHEFSGVGRAPHFIIIVHTITAAAAVYQLHNYTPSA